MTTQLREVTWGDALVVASFRSPGGLKYATDAIRELVGPSVGSRNTFAKLYSFDGPGFLTDRDRFRAWLLLSALGQDPTEWGVADSVVPRAMDAVTLRRDLRQRVLERYGLPPLDSNQQPAG